MDSVTLEDWGEEIFAEGVGVCTKPLLAERPVTIQDGGIEAISLAFLISLRNNACTAGQDKSDAHIHTCSSRESGLLSFGGVKTGSSDVNSSSKLLTSSACRCRKIK